MISCAGNSGPLVSPNGKIKVRFEMRDSTEPFYEILYRDSVVLEPSRLGVVKNGIDFSRNMSLESVSTPKTLEDSYTMLHGKQSEITYRATERTFRLRHQSGKVLEVVFRVSNDGVAFRYHFPGKSEEKHYTSKEKTTFNLPGGSRAWLEPLANVNTGFAQTNPSYEEYYKQNIPVGMPAPDSAGWAYPALFKTGTNWLLISEAGMNGHYPGTRLQQQAPDGNYQVGFPQPGEQFPDGALYPQSKLPWSSPWRIIAIGSLETITESTLATDLARPAVLSDTSWINPGRASWSWAKLKDASITYEVQKRFIDYAAEMGWEYTLVDVNWDTTIGYERIEELAHYAATKDVSLLLWYNSSGSWN
ncbi:MAG TPA: glycoside hydrolase family 97 N-terminal domain-containing protein, partial [Fodinibius sp.]|nr:glycoside hydrolase family 97 N-terminal domain-containing protein [Fodinibius sp.]